MSCSTLGVSRRDMMIATVATATGVGDASASGVGALRHDPGRVLVKSETAPTPPIQKSSGVVLDPRDFGAAGDGRTDDTDALNRMLALMGDGDTAEFSKGVF